MTKLQVTWNGEFELMKRVFEKQGCEKFLSRSLIMNNRRFWNSHQRHKFLRAEASRDILKIRVSELVFPGFQEKFSTADTMLICQTTRKTGNNALEMSQAFQEMTRFKCLRDLNLLEL